LTLQCRRSAGILKGMSAVETVCEKVKTLSEDQARVVLDFIQSLEEDRLDADAARQALVESPERIPYQQVRRELGLPE